MKCGGTGYGDNWNRMNDSERQKSRKTRKMSARTEAETGRQA